jgi:polyphosphate kinase
VRSNDKKRARLAAKQHVLTTLPYDEKDPDRIGVPDPNIVGPAADFLEPTGAVGAASPLSTT